MLSFFRELCIVYVMLQIAIMRMRSSHVTQSDVENVVIASCTKNEQNVVSFFTAM